MVFRYVTKCEGPYGRSVHVQRGDHSFFRVVGVVMRTGYPVQRRLRVFYVGFFFRCGRHLLQINDLSYGVPFAPFVRFLVKSFFGSFSFIGWGGFYYDLMWFFRGVTKRRGYRSVFLIRKFRRVSSFSGPNEIGSISQFVRGWGF